MLNLKGRIFLGMVGVLLLCNIFAFKEVFALAGPRYLKMTALDVGQGDSILIETPARHQIIIDGGPDSSVLGRLQARMPFWDRDLDVVILTHPDKDHVMGLIHILQKYRVDYIVWTGVVRDGQTYQEWIKAVSQAESRGAKVILAKSGQKILSGDAKLDIVHPFENLLGQDFKQTTNDTAIISQLTYGKASFLLTADASSKLEKKLIDAGVILESDVLKVGHHGSKYSTSEEFLQAVSPSVAVISSGEGNSYGHPTKEVLQKLEKFGIKVLRTDQLGAEEIASDGKNLNVK